MGIELPDYHWFVSRHEGRFVTNTYSASSGTLGDSGCISTRTFNYKVFADISSGKEGDFRMVAQAYIIQPWHLGAGKTDFERKEFECSESGVKQASEWLAEISAKYGF